MITIIAALVLSIVSFLLTEWLPLPWYTPMIIAFLIGLVSAKQKIAPFTAGAIGIVLFWLGKSIIPFLANDGLMVSKMSNLFTSQLGFTVTPILLLLLTLIIGGLLGGLALLSGHLFLAPNLSQPNLLRRGRSNRRSSTYKLRLD